MTTLSLVIPCYNESGNLRRLVARSAEVFQRPDVEVVFVDNGSTDDTPRLLSDLIASQAFARTVRVGVNQGYGFGILTGIRAARGTVLAWTHADLQTDPSDALRGLELFRADPQPERLFVKGARYGRPLRDRVFTWGMSLCELVLLGVGMWDINAQPTMFHRQFFESWHNPPHDFSLDLYAYYQALCSRLRVARFPVQFGRRMAGYGHSERLAAELRYSWRTLAYSIQLRRLKQTAR